MIKVHKKKPMEKNKIFAVLTGDIVGSSRLSSDERIIMLSVLKSSISEINELLNLDCNEFPLEIFRGDSFQLVLSKPENALFSALYLRSAIRKTFNFNKRKAIGFLIAAKSILRFVDISNHNNRKQAEFILIGTMLSFIIAILSGLFIKTIIN